MYWKISDCSAVLERRNDKCRTQHENRIFRHLNVSSFEGFLFTAEELTPVELAEGHF